MSTFQSRIIVEADEIVTKLNLALDALRNLGAIGP